MINGLGVFGWGVGGIEAEAVMLGQPMAMLIPEVVGFELTGKLPPGATATDLVLTVTQMLRKKGVVDKFVEFYGAGIGALSLPDRATIANMAPEYGATMGFFPVDDETLDVPALHRPHATITSQLVERYTQGEPPVARRRARSCGSPTRCRSTSSTVEPSLAGPARPQDRVPLKTSRRAWRKAVGGILGDKAAPTRAAVDALGRRGRHAAPGTLGATKHGHDRQGHVHARPRLGRDRGDHELHEHVEPVGAARPRACSRRRRSRKGLTQQAVGEDLARARLAGRHRLPHRGRR